MSKPCTSGVLDREREEEEGRGEGKGSHFVLFKGWRVWCKQCEGWSMHGGYCTIRQLGHVLSTCL